jgi:hypothetical protein
MILRNQLFASELAKFDVLSPNMIVQNCTALLGAFDFHEVLTKRPVTKRMVAISYARL